MGSYFETFLEAKLREYQLILLGSQALAQKMISISKEIQYSTVKPFIAINKNLTDTTFIHI